MNSISNNYLKRLTAGYILLLVLLAFEVHAKTPLTIGVHPYKSPQKLLSIYQPLANLLEEKLGQPVELVIAKDYSTHIEQIGTDVLDIAYLGPASYVKMVEQYGQKPILARQAISGRPTFKGKIITSTKSPLTSLRQLKGKRFAFGDPDSTMSHLVPRYMLIENGVTAANLKFDFLGSHDNVALGVLAGDYDAGAVKEAIFYKYKSRGMRALATTPSLSEHIFVASTRLPANTVAKVKDMLMALSHTDDGMRVIKKIKPKMTGFHPAKDSDYDNLREILRTLKSNKVIK